MWRLKTSFFRSLASTLTTLGIVGGIAFLMCMGLYQFMKAIQYLGSFLHRR